MRDQPFFVPAVLFLVLCAPLILKLVPRNRWYGIRTRAALASDEAWYRINQMGGVLVSLSAGVYLAYAWARPAPAGTRPGFDLFSDHTWAFALPLAASLLALRLLARRLTPPGG